MELHQHIAFALDRVLAVVTDGLFEITPFAVGHIDVGVIAEPRSPSPVVRSTGTDVFPVISPPNIKYLAL